MLMREWIDTSSKSINKSSFTEEQAIIYVAKNLTYEDFEAQVKDPKIEFEDDANWILVISHLYQDCKT